MALYTAKVKSPSGQTQTLRREADCPASLRAALRAEGLVPVQLEEQSARKDATGGAGPARAKKPRRREMQAFMSNFATLLRSGMDLERALRTLEKETSGPLRGVLGGLAERVRHGDSLSAAMAKAEIFTPFQLSVIRAGEFGGNLHYAFARIASALEREMELRAKIRNAVAYPSFLIFFGLASLAVMMLFVLPKFLRIYSEMKATLPWLTTLMLKTSAVLQTHGIWIIPLVGLAGYSAVRYLLRFRENLAADRLRLKIPLLGRIIQNMEVATFLRTLGLLIQSGIPVAQALNISAKVLGSAVFIQAAQEIEKGVQMGSRLSAEMRRHGLFSESVLNLVAVGEESGQLENLLLETAETIEKRIDELVKGMLTFLEPVLILVVGAIIGLIVMSMLLPIFSLSSVLRKG